MFWPLSTIFEEKTLFKLKLKLGLKFRIKAILHYFLEIKVCTLRMSITNNTTKGEVLFETKTIVIAN